MLPAGGNGWPSLMSPSLNLEVYFINVIQHSIIGGNDYLYRLSIF